MIQNFRSIVNSEETAVSIAEELDWELNRDGLRIMSARREQLIFGNWDFI